MSDLSKGRAFGYVRGSTKDQKATLEIQRQAIDAEYNHRLKDQYRWGGHYIDSGVSGGAPLANRPAGCRLMIEVSRGDVVVFHKLDRGFRSLRDMLDVIEQWRLKGVRMLLLDLQCDTGSAVGQMLVGMLGVFADFERSRIRERRADLIRSRRRQGRPPSGRRAPLGFRHEGKTGDKYYVCDPEQRELMGWMLAKFNAGWTVQQIRWQLNQQGTKNWEGQAWTDWSVEAHLKVESVLQKYETERGVDLRGKPATADVIDMIRTRRYGDAG